MAQSIIEFQGRIRKDHRDRSAFVYVRQSGHTSTSWGQVFIFHSFLLSCWCWKETRDSMKTCVGR